MAKQKKSFFERLTGTINADNDDDYYEYDDQYDDRRASHDDSRYRDPHDDTFDQYGGYNDQADRHPSEPEQPWPEDAEEEGQLAVDVYQTPTHIVIQTMAAGVRPEDLDVSITREKCTITGKREGPHNIATGDYFHQELYWGKFSRTVVLPQEIEVDEAQASESHGLLTIRLPKLNTEKQTKLDIHSGE